MYFNPSDKTPVLRIWNGRVAVARWRSEKSENGLPMLSIEDALNWEDLESEAIEVVFDQGGSPTMSGNNPCPEWLSGKAVWKED